MASKLKKQSINISDLISSDSGNLLREGEDGGLLAASGGTRVWYATSNSAFALATATTTTGDFELVTGSVVHILMTNGASDNPDPSIDEGGNFYMDVDNTGLVRIWNSKRYIWSPGEVITLVYNGANYYLVDKGIATTTYYGQTKLSSSTSSTSTGLAATPSAVKAAYDIHNTAFTTATVSTTTKSQSIAATSSCRFNYTQTASSCTYTFTPSAAGYVWYVIITKDTGYTEGDEMSENWLATLISGTGFVIISIASWLWGSFDGLFIGCLFFMLVDIVTGMIGALSSGAYDSSKFSLKKKIGVLIAIAVIYRVDVIVPVLSSVIPAFANWATPL